MAKVTVEGLCQQAQQAMAHGDHDAARQLYEQALSLNPESADIHYSLATVFFLQHDLAQAGQHFKEVIRLDPRRAEGHINLGAIYNSLDKLDEAVAELRRGIQLDHNRAEGFYNLGIVYRRKNQLDLAIEAYREAVRLSPRMADAHYNIANIYFEKEQYTPALAHYRLALQARPHWDKPAHGQERCEALLHPTEAGAELSGGPPTQAELGELGELGETGGPVSAGLEARIDPHRAFNPQTHGMLLGAVQKATIDTDAVSRDLLRIVESEVEPAVKELAGCLLFPKSAMVHLEQSLRKFEKSLAHMRKAQEEVSVSLQRVQRVGEKLLRV